MLTGAEKKMVKRPIEATVLTAVALGAVSRLPDFDRGGQLSFESVSALVANSRIADRTVLSDVSARVEAVWEDPRFFAIEDAYDRFNAIIEQDPQAFASLECVSEAASVAIRASFESMSYLHDVASDIVKRTDAATADRALTTLSERRWAPISVDLLCVTDPEILSDAWRAVSYRVSGDALSDHDRLSFSFLRDHGMTTPAATLTAQQRDLLSTRLRNVVSTLPVSTLIDIMTDKAVRMSYLRKEDDLLHHEVFIASDEKVSAAWRGIVAAEELMDHLPEGDALRDGPYREAIRDAKHFLGFAVTYLCQLYRQSAYRNVAIFDYNDRYYFYNPLVLNMDNVEDDHIQTFLRAMYADHKHPSNEGFRLSEITEGHEHNAKFVAAFDQKARREDHFDRELVGREILTDELNNVTRTIPARPGRAALLEACLDNPHDLEDRVLHFLVEAVGNPMLKNYYASTVKAHEGAATESISTVLGQQTFDAVVGLFGDHACLVAA